MYKRLTSILAGFITLIVFSCVSSAQEEGAQFTFEQITDNVYKASTVSHRTVLLVTEEGVILADPISRNFSTWLKQEIDERFGVPVRYVLNSHHHWDHASGAAVFEDTAIIIGHENMVAHLAAPSGDVPLTGNGAALDSNDNGQLERSETEGAFAANFDLYDYDGDGVLNGAEVARGSVNDVRVPDITYTDKISVSLGGKTAEMVYTGLMTHTDDMSVIVFPEESVGFMVDYISIVRPPRFIQGNQPLETWIEGIRVAEAQGFNIAVGGHGNHAGSEYVTLFREYMEELRDLVAAGIAEGKSIEDLQESIYMEEYKDWISYDEFRESNINDMYNMLTNEF